MLERWRRTQFISLIPAPDLRSARLTACLSDSVSPSIGSGSSEEPPPEIRHSTKSSGASPADHLQNAPGRPLAGLVRHGMSGLDHLNVVGWDGVPVAGHDEA